MKLITMSVCLIAMLWTTTVQAQSYNDDRESKSKSKSEAAAVMDEFNLNFDYLEKSIYARLDGVTLEGVYGSMPLEDMICNYGCLYALKSELLMYFENIELLLIMYDEEEQLEVAEEMEQKFYNRGKGTG